MSRCRAPGRTGRLGRLCRRRLAWPDHARHADGRFPPEAGPIDRALGAARTGAVAGGVSEASLPAVMVARAPGGTVARRRLVTRAGGAAPAGLGPRSWRAGAERRGGGRV